MSSNFQFVAYCLIEVYSHHFVISHTQPHILGHLDRFLLRYLQKAYRPKNPANLPYTQVETKEKIFGLTTKDNAIYRMHIGQLKPLQEFLSEAGISPGLYKIIHYDVPDGLPMRTRMKPDWTLRDRQPEVVDFIMREMDGDYNSRLVTLPTGYGKGSTALWAICQRNQRTIVIVLPKYIEKWVADIQKSTTATDKDIITVQGSDYLRGLIHLGKTQSCKQDFIIISTKTWNIFIDSYLEDRDYCREEYGCTPDELTELLGAGTLLVDEIHEHLHAVYRMFCFLHIGKAIGLSATFLSNDYFVEFIQKTMFPKEIRFQNVQMEQYIEAYGISYSISHDSMKKIKTSERFSTTYSQNAFEKSILKSNTILRNYMNLVIEVVDNGFMDRFEKGHKCVIFVRRIDMCEQIVQAIKNRWPNLDVRKYTEGDPYENLLDADVRVTTQQSAGTAHDIPGLMTNITLDNMNSAQANIQCMGRLRKPASGTARYFAVYSESIPKHVKYHQERRNLLSGRVKTFREFKSRVYI